MTKPAQLLETWCCEISAVLERHRPDLYADHFDGRLDGYM
jgi:hypothetical protein